MVAMSALMTDVKKAVGPRVALKRIGGIPTDEVIYTDDTISVSASTRGLQTFLREIERISEQYGLRLKCDKCVCVW